MIMKIRKPSRNMIFLDAIRLVETLPRMSKEKRSVVKLVATKVQLCGQIKVKCTKEITREEMNR